MAAHLALKAGISGEESERFLSEFFNLLISTLAEGETVRIKDLGTFKVVEVDPRKSVDVSTGEDMVIQGHRKISFIPSRELAAEINAPFEMFESVELYPEALAELESIHEDDRPIEVMKTSAILQKETSAIEQMETASESVVTSEQKSTEEVSVRPELETNGMAEDTVSTERAIIPDIEHRKDDEETEEEITTDADMIDEAGEEYEQTGSSGRKRRGLSFVFGLVVGLLIALVALLAVYWFWLRDVLPADFMGRLRSGRPVAVVANTIAGVNDGIDRTDTVVSADEFMDTVEDLTGEVTEEAVLREAAKIAPPMNEPVYDTISKVRYLTTMAKDHYGNFNLWPYIYKENEKILGHPDRIKPGTPVVVPPLSKYNVDPENPEDIRKAKAMGTAIYKKFNGPIAPKKSSK